MDCLTYPFVVFSRQCQFYPYNITRFSVAAPFSTIVVLNHILNSQVSENILFVPSLDSCPLCVCIRVHLHCGEAGGVMSSCFFC